MSAFIDLAEAHQHLNKLRSVDDGELNLFIETACAVVEYIKGHVKPETFTEQKLALSYMGKAHWPGAAHRYQRWQYVIELVETPVLSVTSVNGVASGVLTLVSPGDQYGLDGGWWLQDTLVHVPFTGLYAVEYVAGLAAVPDRYKLAALELVAHLWNASQVSGGSARQHLGRIDASSPEMTVPGIASALPYRVRELLGIFGPVVPDQVIIA